MKNDLPLVSVVIPTYNNSKYIVRCIESILSQTYKNIEIIVVDDGSEDDTRELLRPYFESDEIHYTFQRNKGVSAARNVGLERAKGNFITFLDADDIWHKEFIHDMIFDRSHYKIAICDCNLLHYSSNGRLLDRKVIRESESEWEVSNLLVNYRDMIGTLARCLFDCWIIRSNSVKFDESLKCREDWDFLLAYVTASRRGIKYVRKSLFSYVKHSMSTTRTMGWSFLHYDVCFLRKWKRQYRALGLSKEYSLLMWDYAREYFYNTMDVRRGLLCLLESVSTSLYPLRAYLNKRIRRDCPQ